MHSWLTIARPSPQPKSVLKRINPSSR
jgi:hypothetical protein